MKGWDGRNERMGWEECKDRMVGMKGWDEKNKVRLGWTDWDEPGMRGMKGCDRRNVRMG